MPAKFNISTYFITWGSNQIQYTLMLSVSVKTYTDSVPWLQVLYNRGKLQIFRLFGNTCPLFIGYRTVLNQVDPDGHSASSTMWEYRNWHDKNAWKSHPPRLLYRYYQTYWNSHSCTDSFVHKGKCVYLITCL